MKNALVLAAVSIALAACSGSSKDAPPGGGGPAAGAGGDGSGAAGAGGTAVTAGDGGAGGTGGTMTGTIAVLSGTVCGDLQLASAQTIPAGATVTICAGTTLTATTTDAAILVQGTLTIAGTATSPVKLRGQGNPGDWQGIDIQRGGAVSATYLEIHDADTPLSARAGATFDIDHVLMDNSNQLLALAESGGTLAHGALHGLGANQRSSPVLLDNASPRITDTVIDQGSYGLVDNIAAFGANSAAVFDHVEVADSHCAFHFNEGTGITISNSFVHHNAYALMAVDSTDGHIVHNNFEDNGVNIGACGTASSEVTDNYFVGDAFDQSCMDAGLVATGTAPPDGYTTGVGPSP